MCCIQFAPNSGHLLTFGSADYKVYCYDLRSTKVPLCILASHNKAVSYVKFVDSVTLVSASTDNTLKLWDLTRANTTPGSVTGCSLTYSGHTNEKVYIYSSYLQSCLDLQMELLDFTFPVLCQKHMFMLKRRIAEMIDVSSYIRTNVYLDVQNFIGLTIADGYIACGSETNAVSIFIPTHSWFSK